MPSFGHLGGLFSGDRAPLQVPFAWSPLVNLPRKGSLNKPACFNARPWMGRFRALFQRRSAQDAVLHCTGVLGLAQIKLLRTYEKCFGSFKDGCLVLAPPYWGLVETSFVNTLFMVVGLRVFGAVIRIWCWPCTAWIVLGLL